MRTASSKKQSSRRHFDRWARRYERDRVSKRLTRFQQEALDALELGPSDHLLDVGCGTGAAVRSAAALVERAVGVDLSPAMIARGRELADGIPNVELREADAEALPFEDGGFTALLCTTSFHHYPRPERAVAEMARVLAPGGRLVIGDAVTDEPIVRLIDRGLRLFQRSHVGLQSSDGIMRLMAGAGLEEPGMRAQSDRFWAIVTARKPAAAG